MLYLKTVAIFMYTANNLECKEKSVMKKLILGILLNTCIVFSVTSCGKSSVQDTESMSERMETENMSETIGTEAVSEIMETEIVDTETESQSDSIDTETATEINNNINQSVEENSDNIDDLDYPYVRIVYEDPSNKPSTDQIFAVLDGLGVPHDESGTVSISGTYYGGEGIDADIYNLSYSGDNGSIAYTSVYEGETEVLHIYRYTPKDEQ